MSPSGDEYDLSGAASAAPAPAGSGASGSDLLSLLGNGLAPVALLGFDLVPAVDGIPAPTR